MLNAEELADRLTELATGRAVIQEFEEWFVRASWDVAKGESRELGEAVYSLELELAEHSSGHRSNSCLRVYAGELARQLSARRPISVLPHFPCHS
jgi:hypothetical protein